MVYRFDIRKNLRVILLAVIPVVSLSGSVALLILIHPLLGLVALAVSAYVSYHLVKFLRLQVKSEIRTYDDEVVRETSMGEKTQIEWESITHAARYSVGDEPDVLFVYSEINDKLLTVPFHYSQMDELEREIRKHVAGMMALRSERDGLVGCLKEQLGLSDEEEA